MTACNFVIPMVERHLSQRGTSDYNATADKLRYFHTQANSRVGIDDVWRINMSFTTISEVIDGSGRLVQF